MEHWDSNFAANCAKNETATSIDGTSSSSSSSINSRSRAVDVTGTIPVGGLGVTVGQFAETRRRFSVRDVEQFGRLVGDDNPLHRRQRLSWTGNGKQNETNDTKNSGLLASTEDHPLLLVKQEVETTIDQNNNERVHFYYTRPIVHGMLVASLFTSILGTLIPGAVYLSQDLEFLKPVYATNVDDDDDDNLDDDDIDSCSSIAVGRIDVIRIRPFRRRRKGLVLVCDTTVTYQGEEAVRGTAKVWIPNGIEKDELS